MTPQVGSELKPKRIVAIDNGEIVYRILGTTEDHYFGSRAFAMAVMQGSWVLRYPDQIRLPVGA